MFFVSNPFFVAVRVYFIDQLLRKPLLNSDIKNDK